MKMGLPFRCHYWSVIQVAIVVTCHRGRVSSERAQGCVESQLSLRCPEMKVIQITSVVLGDSNCYGTSCCIKDNDCTENANANHRIDVHRKCNGQSSCTVDVSYERIPCGFFSSSNNDFERITYNCRDGNATTNNSTNEEPTEGEKYPDSEPDDNRDNSFVKEIAQSCVGSQLSLKCEEMKIIRILDVIIGSLNGIRTACNISDSNCTHDANASHTMDVHLRCNGQSSCTINVVQEKINCGALSWRIYNDLELITYNCLNDSRNNLTSTHGTVTATHLFSSTEAGAGTHESNSHMLTIVIVTTCSIILPVIILVIVVMYRRKKRSQTTTRLDPVDNCQNECDIYANETQGTSQHSDGYAQAMYSQIDNADSPKKAENQIIYSEVELMETSWKDGQTTGQTKAAAKQSSAQLAAGTVSKSNSSQDDGCQTVIENDLYGMADNCAKDTAVASPTRSLAGAVSKNPSSQDDEGLTVIENDIYCH